MEVVGIVGVLFFLNQHKIGHSIAKKKVSKEIIFETWQRVSKSFLRF
ncbi:hypothetical protein HBE96_11965 [Clostridium sp. P21]|uniref:Uncharacterized protein n=1 Tax=Clostridium muellerianum TaxID=2716538 RepID=A0A7Y0EHA1_9CLOT|nr:hypothetical protein [Clostridium muellerianum]NMM63381.1 hypothetical protein [Clostridium muellerianum]